MKALRDAVHAYLDEIDQFVSQIETGKKRLVAGDGTPVEGHLVWPPDVALQHTKEKRQLRDSFINSKAFSRVLDAMDEDAEESILTAVDLSELLIFISREWQRILAPGSKYLSDMNRLWPKALRDMKIVLVPVPGVHVFPNRDEDEDRKRRKVLQLFSQAHELLKPEHRHKLEQLIEEVSDSQSFVEFVGWLNPAHVGTRGAAADSLSAFRGVTTRELDSRLPRAVEMREATIASLLKLAGDPRINRQLVRSLLKIRTK